ncbi:MAG: hypothetical protein NW224_02300 [Leptolyngbyaceae cyanobacterium bins.302]|nr:hypothetical protein [Leptolyngbyaceae cyanobacterium bins.302]
MTRHVDQLTLTGAMSLLTYLQYSQLSPSSVKAAAIAATLCEMLSQLEDAFPGITKEYGWEKIMLLSEQQPGVGVRLDRDRSI